MSDIVAVSMKCPQCGHIIKDFQSKDGLCTSSTLYYSEVDNFYTDCLHCGSWIDFHYTGDKKLSDYQCTYKPKKGRTKIVTSYEIQSLSQNEIAIINARRFKGLGQHLKNLKKEQAKWAKNGPGKKAKKLRAAETR